MSGCEATFSTTNDECNGIGYFCVYCCTNSVLYFIIGMKYYDVDRLYILYKYLLDVSLIVQYDRRRGFVSQQGWARHPYDHNILICILTYCINKWLEKKRRVRKTRWSEGRAVYYKSHNISQYAMAVGRKMKKTVGGGFG